MSNRQLCLPLRGATEVQLSLPLYAHGTSDSQSCSPVSREQLARLQSVASSKARHSRACLSSPLPSKLPISPGVRLRQP